MVLLFAVGMFVKKQLRRKAYTTLSGYYSSS